MVDEKKKILTEVAKGRLSPDEAAKRLEELDRARDEEPQAPPPDMSSVARIRLVGRFGNANIEGDPSVQKAVVDGPAALRQEGDLLIIDASPSHEELPWFWFTGAGRPDRDSKIWGQRFRKTAWRWQDGTINIRVNPDLPLDVELMAGTLRVRGMHAAIRADVSAGSAKIEGFAGPLDISVATGSVQASGVLSSGASRVRCDLGGVRLELEKGSNVTINARTRFGKVVLPGSVSGTDFFGDPGVNRAVVGDGSGTLEVETNFGSVRVDADTWR